MLVGNCCFSAKVTHLDDDFVLHIQDLPQAAIVFGGDK
jgi:hypothetical protein